MNVNECDESSTCDRDAGNPVSCVDNVGSFECICDDGFTIDSNGLCTDNDECGEDPCGINSGNQAGDRIFRFDASRESTQPGKHFEPPKISKNNFFIDGNFFYVI